MEHKQQLELAQVRKLSRMSGSVIRQNLVHTPAPSK